MESAPAKKKKKQKRKTTIGKGSKDPIQDTHLGDSTKPKKVLKKKKKTAKEKKVAKQPEHSKDEEAVTPKKEETLSSRAGTLGSKRMV